MKKISIVLLIALTFSCVSKKKYLALEHENGEIKSELLKTRVAKEDLEAKFDKIQSRVDAYNTKLATLKQENDTKLDVVGNVVISNATKSKMRETLKHVDANKLSEAKTLKDSMNLAVAYNRQ